MRARGSEFERRSFGNDVINSGSPFIAPHMRVQIAAINKIGRVRGGVGRGNVAPGTVGNLRQVGARARGGVGDR